MSRLTYATFSGHRITDYSPANLRQLIRACRQFPPRDAVEDRRAAGQHVRRLAD